MANCSKVIPDPLESLVKYTNAIKPYHTKILEVATDYIHRETISVFVKDKNNMEIIFNPSSSGILGCENDGYGISPFGSVPGISICDIDWINNKIILSGDHHCLFTTDICLVLELLTNPPSIINYHKVVYTTGTSFTMPFIIQPYSLNRRSFDMFINGVKQIESVDYTITFPSTITTTTPIITGDILEFYIYGQLASGTVGPIYETFNVVSDGSGQTFPLTFDIDAASIGYSNLKVYINGRKTDYVIVGTPGDTLTDSIQIPSLLLTGDIIEVYGNYGDCDPTPAISLIQPEYYNFSYSGITTFNVPFSIKPPILAGTNITEATMELYINGIKRIYLTDFTIAYPGTITLTCPVVNGDNIEIFNYSQSCDANITTIYNPLCCSIINVSVSNTPSCYFGQPTTIIELGCDLNEGLLPIFPLLPNQALSGYVYPGDIPVINVIPYSIPTPTTPNESAYSDIGSNMFVVAGDHTCLFCQGYKFNVDGLNDGVYTTLYSDLVAGETRIRVIEDIPNTGLVPGNISFYQQGYSEHRKLCCNGQEDNLILTTFKETLTFQTNLSAWFQAKIIDIQNNDTFVVIGDITPFLSPTDTFELISDDANAGIYTVLNITASGNTTTIETTNSPPFAITNEKDIEYDVHSIPSSTTIILNGDATFSMSSGDEFRLVSDDGNTGIYQVNTIVYNSILNKTTISILSVFDHIVNHNNEYVVQRKHHIGFISAVGWV